MGKVRITHKNDKKPKNGVLGNIYKFGVKCLKNGVRGLNKISKVFVKIITPLKQNKVKLKVRCINCCPTAGGGSGPEASQCTCFATNCNGCKCDNCREKMRIYWKKAIRKK
jgi:hypothetical protein